MAWAEEAQALDTVKAIPRTPNIIESWAAELGLTHGAVSRHVATLEAWLGQPLFRR